MTIQDFFSQSITGDLYNDLKRFWDLSESTVESNKKSNQSKQDESDQQARENGTTPTKLSKKQLLTTDPVRIFTDFLKKVKSGKVDVGGMDNLTSHPEHNILLKALASIKTKSKLSPNDQFKNIYSSALVESGKTMTMNPLLFKHDLMPALDKQKCINNIRSIIDKSIKFALQKFKFKSNIESELLNEPESPSPSGSLPPPDNPPNSPVDIKHFVENPNEIPEMSGSNSDASSNVSPIIVASDASDQQNQAQTQAPSFGDLQKGLKNPLQLEKTLQNVNPQQLEKQLEQEGVDKATQKVKSMFLNKFN